MDSSLLHVFVYGTLKRGFRNHERLCRGCVSVEEAEIPGKLYGLPEGYPALVIPARNVLAEGTDNPAADLAAQFGARATPPGSLYAPRQRGDRRYPAHEALLDEQREDEAAAGGSLAGWDRVQGEVLTFNDAARRLPALDRLENFRPGHRSHYQRVLAAAVLRRKQIISHAWVYVMDDPGPAAQRLPGGRWPGPRTAQQDSSASER